MEFISCQDFDAFIQKNLSGGQAHGEGYGHGWPLEIGLVEAVGRSANALRPPARSGSHGDDARCHERLVEVGDDVVDILDAYGEADIPICDAAGVLLLR